MQSNTFYPDISDIEFWVDVPVYTYFLLGIIENKSLFKSYSHACILIIQHLKLYLIGNSFCWQRSRVNPADSENVDAYWPLLGST